MIYDFNLILTIPHGDDESKKVIEDDVHLVEKSVRKHQKFAPVEYIDDPDDPETDPEYKRQIIKGGELLAGGAVEEFTTSAKELWKGTFDSDLSEYVDSLNKAATSRLVIFAHGNYVSRSVGGINAERMAEIVALRLKVTRVTRISVIACFGGGFHGIGNPTAHSFAERFHFLLGETYHIRTRVSARTGIMTSSKTMGTGQRMVWYPGPDGLNPKDAGATGTWKYKEPGGKYLWYWDGDAQKVKSAYTLT